MKQDGKLGGVSAPQSAEEPVVPAIPPVGRHGLHQPWRTLVALAELAAAGLIIWAAFWCWSRGDVTITTVLEDGTRLVSTRLVGHWLAAAIGLGAVAAVLVLDVLRQLVLAVRARPPRKRAAGTANSQVTLS